MNAQEILMSLKNFEGEYAGGKQIQTGTALKVAAKSIDTIEALVGLCGDLALAYTNKDSELPHQFEVDAFKDAVALIGNNSSYRTLFHKTLTSLQEKVQ